MGQGEDRGWWRGAAPRVEVGKCEGHECVATEVGTLADELPSLIGEALGREPADRVVHVTEETIRVEHPRPHRVPLPEGTYVKTNTRDKERMSSDEPKTWTFRTHHA